MGTDLEFTEGMQFDKGYISPYFVTDAERMEAVLDDPYILVNQGKISSVSDLLPLLEKVIGAGKSLFIIAEDVEGEALSTLVVNKIRGTFTSVTYSSSGRRSETEEISFRCWRRSSARASRCSSLRRTSRARHCRRWWSTRSAPRSRRWPSRPRRSAIAARPCCRTSRRSPARRS